MWRWLRRLYLALLWLSVPLALVGLRALWRRWPGQWLGVNWVWFAGAAWLAWSLMVLATSQELPESPLPPTVSWRAEVQRWLFYLVAGVGVAGMFALWVAPPLVVTQALRRWVGGIPRRLLLVPGVAVWMGWFMGTWFVLAWLNEQQVVARFRRWVGGLAVPSSEEIATLLRRAPLPAAERQRLLARLQREGMTPALARAMLAALERHPPLQNDPRPLKRRAMLAQALHRWLTHHE